MVPGRFISRAALTILLSGGLWMAQALSVPLLSAAGVDAGFGQAVAAEKKKNEEETRRTPAMRNQVYQELSKAQKAIEANKVSEGIKILDALKNGRLKLNSYEVANLYNFYAYAYYSQEKYDKVIEAYEKVLAQPELPLAMEINTKYQLAQLYTVTQKFNKALDMLNQWFATQEQPPANAYILRAQVEYQMQRYDPALADTEKAMRLAKSQGKQPKEQWYLLERVLYYEKGDMKKVAQIIEEMLHHWPKPDYWEQLSGIYGSLKNDKRQLTAYEVSYLEGNINRQEQLLNMAYLYLGASTPYYAADVIKKGIASGKIEKTSKNYQLLANSLRQAQDVKEAIPAMEQSARLAKDGKPWAQLANVYLDANRYQDAAKAARTALNKGGLKRPDNARIVLGMALYNLDKLPEARGEFERAAKDKRSARVANQWIKYLDSEIQRRKSLAEG